jgi:hypothetical protein
MVGLCGELLTRFVGAILGEMIAELIEHDVDEQALQLRRIGRAIVILEIIDALFEVQRVETETDVAVDVSGEKLPRIENVGASARHAAYCVGNGTIEAQNRIVVGARLAVFRDEPVDDALTRLLLAKRLGLERVA